MLSNRGGFNCNPLSILYIGPYYQGTCKARWQALSDLGHQPVGLSYDQLLERFPRQLARLEEHFVKGPGVVLFNRLIMKAVREKLYDWVWVDQGKAIYPKTVRTLKFMGLFLIHHINDDFKNPRGRFERYMAAIPDYNVHLSIHSIHLRELAELGAAHVIQTYHGFDPAYCFPNGRIPDPDPFYRTDVIYIGHREPHTEELVFHLVDNDINVSVWGPGWERCRNRSRLRNSLKFRCLCFPDYARAIASAKIALAFLSRANRNKSTIRSFEIPAIGTFLLGERTDEHLMFYKEGEEAEFFDSPAELLEKARYYLKNDEARKNIAMAGHRRAITSGYTYLDRIRTDLEGIMPIYEQFLGNKREISRQ